MSGDMSGAMNESGERKGGAMSWVAVCRLIAAAGDQARDMAIGLIRDGAMPAGMLWVGLRGAAAFVAAIARGDVAPLDVHEARDAVCRECPARTMARDAAGSVRTEFLGYCGEALVARMDGPVEKRTCGCLLDAANAVGSHACPRGKFVGLSVGGREVGAGAGGNGL